MKVNIETVKNRASRFFSSVFFVMGVYILVVAVFFSQLAGISAYNTRIAPKQIIEAVILPQISMNAMEIFNVDPLLTSSGTESVLEIRRNISYLVFSTLFKAKVGGELQPDLVSSYTFKDAKDVQIKLVENARWHDGTAVTAHDVIFTLNIIRAIGEDGFYYGAVNGDEIQYEAVNDYELKITLAGDSGARPNAAYPYELTFPILPKHKLFDTYSQTQLQTLPSTDFGAEPVGSGILVYTKNHGSELHFTRNADYYHEPVSFDTYVYRLYQSYADVERDFALKNVDVFTRKDLVAEDEMHTALVRTGARPTTTVLRDRRFVLYFNIASKDSSSPFVKSVSLRDGLAHVINRDAIIEAVHNNGRAIWGPIDQSSWAFAEEVQNEQVYDLENFTKRVEAQGYVKNGEYYEKNGTRLAITLTYLQGDMRQAVALSLRDSLQKAGIELRLNVIGTDADSKDRLVAYTKQASVKSDIEKFNDIVNNRTFEALLTTVNHHQEPDLYTEWHSTKSEPGGLNLSGLNSKVIDISLVEARIEADQEKRKANYLRFQRTFIQEVPAFYLMNPAVVSYFSSRISGSELPEITDIQNKYQNIAQWQLE